MSKRLFILGSLLETHPGRAPTEARMWTPVVIEPQVRTEGGGAACGAAIGQAIGPLAQQRLNEALGFAIGLGPIGTGEALAHVPALTQRGEDTRAVDLGVVGEQPPDADAAPTKPGQGPLQERGARGRVVGRQDFGVGQPRGVIDRDVEIFPAGPPPASPAVAMNPMTDPRPSRFKSMCNRSPTCGHS